MALDDLRWVVFSDHHRGQNDGADDFAPCALGYRSALSHYLSDGFGLCLLGDVEELWECTPEEALHAHSNCLELESRFAYRDRLVRIFGNHDDHWTSRGVFSEAQRAVLADAPEVDVKEAVLFEVLDPDLVGTILLAHGHQGSTLSDRFSFLSRFLVRSFWRPWQRRTGHRTSSLSNDYQLRHKHELDLSRWAAKKPGLLLATGHTHHPVFCGEARETYLERQLIELREELEGTEDSVLRSDLELRIRHFGADLKYREALTEGSMLRFGESNVAYFNAGCCSFRTGSITGLELADGEIRLVRWRDGERDVLRSRGLRQLFQERQGLVD